MKKGLIVISFILMLIGSTNGVFAQEETESQSSEINTEQTGNQSLTTDIFEGKTWWMYSKANVNDTSDKTYQEYVEKFDTLESSKELAIYFDSIIDEIVDVDQDSFDALVSKVIVDEIKEEGSESFSYRIYDHGDNNLDFEGTYEIKDNNGNNLYEVSLSDDSDNTNKVFLRKNDSGIYIITKGESNEEGRERIQYKKFIPSDNEELQPLKDAIDDIQSENVVNNTTQESTNSSLSEEADELNPDDYPYETDYEIIMRSSDDKVGDKINIYGTVIQVQEDKESKLTVLRVATQGRYDGVYMIYMSSPEVRILEDDVVDVYGTFLGVDSYTAVLGNTVTVPMIFADEVWVQGIDF